MDYNYEQIVKYLKNELSSAEMQSFEQELSINKTLKEEVILYKDVEASLSNQFNYEKEDSELQITFNKLGKKYATEYSETQSETTATDSVTSKTHSQEEINQTKPSIIRRLFPLAALAAAAALLLFMFNPFTQQLSPAQLADQNFTPYTLETFMGNGDSDEFLKKGKKYYNGEAYALAIETFDQYLITNPTDGEVLLAKGSAQFKLNKIDASIQTFQQINNKTSAKWYLALAHLKNGESEKAKTLLQGLSKKEDNKLYTEKAKELLKEL